MTRLSLALLYLFGALWGAAALAGIALPRAEIAALDGFEGVVGVVLGWAEAQALVAFGLALAAHACVIGGRRRWAALAWLSIPAVLAIALGGLDPRLAAAVPEEARPGYNALRALLPMIRLASVLGLLLIGMSGLLRRPGSRADRMLAALVPLATCLAWITLGWVGEAAALTALALPGLILLAMLALQLAEGERAGGAHGFVALIVLLVGLGMLAGDGQRIDLSPAFLALPLLFVAAVRRAPDAPPLLPWVHALAIAGLVAWLSPTISEMIPRPAPTSLAEIRASVAAAAQARINAGLALTALTLAGLIATFRRRQARPPAQHPAGQDAIA